MSGNLPSDFGFAIDVHAHEPETIYVVPILSDAEHYPPEGKLRVYRSRTGGNEWEPLTKGLPQEHCYVDVLRDAMSVDTLDSCGDLLRHNRGSGLRVGRRRRLVERDRLGPARGSLGRSSDPGMITVVLPAHLKTLIGSRTPVELDVAAPVTQRRVLDALEARHPVLRGTIRDPATQKRRPFIRFFACEEDLSHESPDDPLPEAVVSGREPYFVVGAMAGG